MESSINASKENNKENESAKPNLPIESLKSNYFLQKLYDNMTKKKKLEIVKYNKRIQNRINLDIKDYKGYSEAFSSIEIEIIPKKDKYGEFIIIQINKLRRNDLFKGFNQLDLNKKENYVYFKKQIKYKKVKK